MIKKLLLLITILASSTLLLTNQHIAKNSFDEVNFNVDTMAFTPDEKVAIELHKNGTTFEIRHTSGFDIIQAVTEYVIVENGENISRMETFDVINSRIESYPGTVAAKVHQLIVSINRNTYRYGTTNQNSAPANYNWSNVTRKNIIEIKTTDFALVKTNKVKDHLGNYHQYHEFYFDFTKKHDEIVSIDVDYMVRRAHIFGIKGKWVNVHEQNLSANKEWKILPYGWDSAFGNHDRDPLYVKQLATNNSSKKGTHVARIAPTAENYNNKDVTGTWWNEKGFEIQNFAIIRIEYIVDGEFIVDDVVNDPISPEYPSEFQWLIDFINSIQRGLSGIIEFFSSNASVIIKGLVIIGGLILYAIFSPFFKLIFKAIKLAFDAVISLLAKILGVFF